MLVFYREPVITLLSKPHFLEPADMKVDWLGEATEAERLVEFAGRLCYMSQRNPAQRTNAAYLENINESGHGSVLEHANFSVLAEGVSRSLTHEWVRHRAGWAYSQLSQRFVDESDAAMVVPPAMLNDAELLEEFERESARGVEAYGRAVENLMPRLAHIEDKTLRRKKAREAARAFLPNATETKIVMTANVRAWRTVLAIRGDLHADAEINRLARMIAVLLQTESPNFFQDMKITPEGVFFGHHKV
jgi:thymidylate synthase (FAD)